MLRKLERRLEEQRSGSGPLGKRGPEPWLEALMERVAKGERRPNLHALL